jgi:hypothetical protein
MAYPVEPPRLRPIASTTSETGKASMDPIYASGDTIENTAIIKTKVAMISVARLFTGLSIAPLVQNIPR